MANSQVAVTQGSGKNVATYSFTEESATKEAQRVVLNNSSGTEMGTSGSPLRTDPTGSTAQPVSGTVTANLSATDNTVLDNIDADTSAIQTAVEAISTSTGAIADAAATAGSTGSLQAKLRLITSQLDSIKTAVETLDNVVSGSEAQVDIVGALPAGTNAIGKLAANNGVDIGDVDVTSISAGTNLIGDIDVQPRTTGGWSVGNFTSGDTYTALTATAQVIKASAGKFGGYYIYNPNAAATYVLIYNIAAASVTVGTSTAKLVFCIPAGAGANLEILAGIPFDTAMSIAAATTGGGNSAPATALEAMIYYK